MSTWIEIKDPEDIDIQDMSNGQRDINILYSDDNFGNNYITMPLDLLLNRLRELGAIPTRETNTDKLVRDDNCICSM